MSTNTNEASNTSHAWEADNGSQAAVNKPTKSMSSLRDPNGQLAQGLGWFSLGLGLAEFLAPRGVAKIAGVDPKHTGLIRMFGLREIASGVGIFMQRKPVEALWSRVAGDALDLACLGAAFASPSSKKGRLAFATASVLGVTVADVLCAKQHESKRTLTDKAGVLR